MRVKLTIALVLLISLIAVSLRLQPQATVQADPLLQGVPRLDGVNIYFGESNGEASRYDRSDAGISRLAGLLRQQGATLFTLDWHSRFPQDVDLLILAGPATDLSPDQTARLWSYVTNGGRLLLLANPIFETTSNAALTISGGLFSLMWNDIGLRGRNDVVVTERTAASLPTPEPSSTEEAAPSPQPGLIADFTTSDIRQNHPITADLDGPLAFFTSRSIEFDASIQDVTVTPLVFSGSQFYGEAAYNTYLQNGQFAYDTNADTARGPLALAAAFEDAKNGTRMVLIGDRQFVTNGAGFLTSPPGSASFVYPTNVRFTLNAITWLVNTQEIALSLPTPGPTSTPSLTPSPTPTYTPSPTATATPTT